MAEFVEINYQGNLPGTDFMWGVHVKGCADIDREMVRRFGRGVDLDGSRQYILSDYTATTMRELLDLIVDEETRELGWGDQNVKVHHCVKTALRGTAS